MSGYCYRANDWSSPQLLALAVAAEEYGDTLPDGSTERAHIREAVRQIGLADKHTETVASATSLSLQTAETFGDGIISDANDLQNLGSEVRNTQHSSDMVELVAAEMRRHQKHGASIDRLAQVALEASHHAELVEELAEVTEVAKGAAKREAQYFDDRKEFLLALKRSRIALNLVPANDKRFDPANHTAIKKATDIIDAALAKIGGEA